MKFNGSERKILETLFGMSQGYVLDFSNRTMEEFFQEHFGIEIYNPKYDRENLSASKANRLRAIWEDEDDLTVGKTIFSLIEYMEVSSMLNDKEISPTDLLLTSKAKEIATKLVSAPNSISFQAEAKTVLEKSKIIKDFTALPLSDFSLNKKIYLLRILYSYYEAILRAYYGNGLIFLGSGIDELNVSFKILRRKLMEVILSEPSFAELKESQCYQGLIEPMTSLYSAPHFLDGTWTDGVEQYLIDFRDVVADKDLFENNSEIHPFDKCVALLLGTIKTEVESLESIMREKERNFFQQFPSGKKADPKKDDAPKPEETVIKHEHTLRFENNQLEITKMPELQIRGLEEGFASMATGQKEAKYRFPHKLPNGTRWENFVFKFLNDDTVQILVQGKKETAHYRDMGLEGKGGKPSVLWILLRVLAKRSGEIAISDPEANTKYKKQKQGLTEALQSYFSLDFDPFHPYATAKAYKTKFVVAPPDNGFAFEKKITSHETPKEDNPFADIDEYMNETAPIIAQTGKTPPDDER